MVRDLVADILGLGLIVAAVALWFGTAAFVCALGAAVLLMNASHPPTGGHE